MSNETNSTGVEGCDVANLCLNLLDRNGDSYLGMGVELFILAYAFTALGTVADSRLAVSLETLCIRWDIPGHVAGATFMALGSSIPEIIINFVSTLKAISDPDQTPAESSAQAELGLAAIVGSSMIAFTLLPGLCGLATSDPLALRRGPVLRDTIFYAVSLAFLLWAVRRGDLTVLPCSIMVVFYVIYICSVVFAARIRLWVKSCRTGEKFTEEKVEELTKKASSVYILRAKSSVSYLSGAGNKARTMVSFGSRPDLGDDSRHPVGDGPRSFNMLEFEDDQKDAGENNGIMAKICGVWAIIMVPSNFLMDWTCPYCDHDKPELAKNYPWTFLSGFTWIAVLATIISAVVTRWGIILGLPLYIMGLCVISFGGAVPDVIQSVAVARMGYGTMAISNACGAQILNINIGLGVPWLIVAAAGSPVKVDAVKSITQMMLFQSWNLTFYFFIVLFPILGTWMAGGIQKAMLNSTKGKILTLMYFITMTAFIVYSQFINPPE